MSVDTYLRGKDVSRYQAVSQHDFKLLIAPALLSQARSITLDVGSFLFWRSLKVEAEPLGDHFHSPACHH